MNAQQDSNNEDDRRPRRHPKIVVKENIQKVVKDEIVCPLSGIKFQIYRIENPNYDSQNVDSDGNSYYIGTDPNDYAIQISPNTLYACETSEIIDESEMKSKNNNPLKSKTIKKLVEVLDAYKKKNGVQDPKNLETWKKMELAAICYEAKGASNEKIGEYYLRAAWSVRKRITWRTLYTEFKDPESVVTEINRLESAISKGPLTVATSIHRMLLLLSHRSGFNNSRDTLIDFIKTNTKNKYLQKEMKQIQDLINVEKSYMEKSLEYINKAIAEKETKDYDLIFKKAELLRRIGKKEEAHKIFKELAEDENTPEKIFKLTSFLMKNINR